MILDKLMEKKDLEIRHLREKQKFKELLYGKFKQATRQDYLNWLKGYIENGGEITHSYEYNMNLDHWKVVTSDFYISPLFGSSSYYIVVPFGVQFLGGELGHNELYFMDGYFNMGGFIPKYKDTIF